MSCLSARGVLLSRRAARRALVATKGNSFLLLWQQSGEEMRIDGRSSSGMLGLRLLCGFVCVCVLSLGYRSVGLGRYMYEWVELWYLGRCEIYRGGLFLRLAA